ncbi:F-box domain containing protein [Parasponia andersonii]|uniref:F-box domain containing protein n=1 Tax=Parasponia andersonii TaxID=3476 RepID=A0A2P5AR86_PARAD|nr:F-box domain containing protein [Parasponia andersonii]
MMMLRVLLGLFRNRRWYDDPPECNDLPEEVLVEIFSWLPADSLIQFKCVSKSWYGLISFLIKNPEFVSKHLRNIDNKISSSTCLVFTIPRSSYWGEPDWKSKRRGLLKSVTILHDYYKTNRRRKYVCEDFRLPTLPSDLDLDHAYKSHCNGIICLAIRETVILCNPAINEWRTLPKTCLINYGGFVLRRVLLGWDSSANDCKVAMFGHYRVLHGQIEYFIIRAEVYRLRSDSWNETGFQLALRGYPKGESYIFCKGVFYWFVRTHNVIVSLNMFDEVFYSNLLPIDLAASEKLFVRLAVWNESIASFVFWREEGVTESIQVLAPGDNYDGVSGIPCSWIKILTINPQASIAFPLAFLKNDEVLMKTKGGRFVLYNLHKQTRSELTSLAVDLWPTWGFLYVKSLLSVQAGNQSRS